MREVIVSAMPGCISLRIFVRFVAWVWLTAKTMDLPIVAGRISLRFAAGTPRT